MYTDNDYYYTLEKNSLYRLDAGDFANAYCGGTDPSAGCSGAGCTQCCVSRCKGVCDNKNGICDLNCGDLCAQKNVGGGEGGGGVWVPPADGGDPWKPPIGGGDGPLRPPSGGGGHWIPPSGGDDPWDGSRPNYGDGSVIDAVNRFCPVSDAGDTTSVYCGSRVNPTMGIKCESNLNDCCKSQCNNDKDCEEKCVNNATNCCTQSCGVPFPAKWTEQSRNDFEQQITEANPDIDRPVLDCMLDNWIRRYPTAANTQFFDIKSDCLEQLSYACQNEVGSNTGKKPKNKRKKKKSDDDDDDDNDDDDDGGDDNGGGTNSSGSWIYRNSLNIGLLLVAIMFALAFYVFYDKIVPNRRRRM